MKDHKMKRDMKKNFFRTFLLIVTVIFSAACSSLTRDGSDSKSDNMGTETKTLSGGPEFDIVTDLGTIRIRLYNETPAHRDNFAKLVSDGFMIQTGDPLTKDPSKSDYYGTGGPGYTIPAEFNPVLTHKKGAVAAARRGAAANPKKESSGSQFYIVQDADNCSQLDGEYTVFGETVSGFDVIDKIAAVDTDRRDRPVHDVHIRSIRPVFPVNSAGSASADTTDIK